MAIVIEFVGLSGSGKSALARKAVQYLKAHGLNVFCRGRGNTLLYEYFRKRPPEYGGIKWFVLKRFFQGAPHFLAKYMAYTFYLFSMMNLVCRFETRNPQLTGVMHGGIESNYHSEQGKQWALTMVYKIFTEYQIVHELQGWLDANTVIILDEGRDRIPRIINALGDVQPVEKTVSYIDQIPLPDLVIHVDTEPSVCSQRVATRRILGYSALRLKQSSLEKQTETLENCRLCTARTCEMLASNKVPVYKVSNSADFDSAVKSLQEYLGGFFKLGQSEQTT